MNDFADWFSPIIVKELRQGMRSRAFLLIFLAIQFFMIVCVIGSLGDGSHEAAAGFFWTFIGAAILFAMPLRGLAALNGEMKGNTLELMLLTQLSAWRITAGKWLALVLQTLLLVCAVLPYVVLRYFLGGVNLVDDLVLLGLLLIGSALATALAIGFSGFMQSLVGRIGIGVLFFAGFYLVPLLLFNISRRGGTSPSVSSWLAAAAVLGPLLVLELFELGVGKIAPSAENHCTRKRLIAASLLAASILLGRALHEPAFLLILGGIAAAPICLGALVEETPFVPSLYLPFLRRGLPGRAFGRLFYPGWASGLWFVLLAIAATLWAAPFSWTDTSTAFRVAALLETLFVPLAIVRLCFRRAANLFPFYLGLQLMLFVTAVTLSANFNLHDPHLIWAGCVPTLGLFLHLWDYSALDQMALWAALLALLGFFALFLLSLKEWKTIAAMEREAAKLNL